MSDPHVTITLGSSGKVVKKSSKRSWAERENEGFRSSASTRFGNDLLVFDHGAETARGPAIAENDLRAKIIHKRRKKQLQNLAHEGMELETMGKVALRPDFHRYADTYSDRTYHNISFVSKRNRSGELGSVDAAGKIFSHSVGGPRVRSPDGFWRGSRVLPSSRTFEATGSAGISRYRRYLPTKMSDGSRLTSSTPPTIATSISPATVNWVSQTAPINGTILKVPSRVEEHKNVSHFLNSIGLGKYALAFQAEEVDMTILKAMGDKDLKDMGIPMGPRKKILLSLLSPQRLQASSSHH